MSEGVVVRHHTVELVDVLATVRPEEESTFTTDPELLKNRQLLWHGSGMGNWGSILKTGLRIAPPEAPSTGWLFDKGATHRHPLLLLPVLVVLVLVLLLPLVLLLR